MFLEVVSNPWFVAIVGGCISSLVVTFFLAIVAVGMGQEASSCVLTVIVGFWAIFSFCIGVFAGWVGYSFCIFLFGEGTEDAYLVGFLIWMFTGLISFFGPLSLFGVLDRLPRIIW